MPTIQEEVKDLELVKVLNKRTRGELQLDLQELYLLNQRFRRRRRRSTSGR